jgi:uncharacterized repeat protein (TIGR01451 family)
MLRQTGSLSRTKRTARQLLRVTARSGVVLALVAGSVVAAGLPAQAFNNFSAPLTGGTDFATGFATCAGNIAPVGLIQDGTNFFATDICNKSTYKFPASGGPASGATVVQNLFNLNLVRAHGVYYAGTNALPQAGIYTFDPATLAVGKLVVPFPQVPYGLVGDPLSNDLYVSSNGIWRIQNPDSASPVLTHVYTSDGFDGMSISADGQHIWAANRTHDSVQEFSRPGPNGMISLLANVPVGRGVDGIAIARGDAPGGVANNVFVNDNDGTIVRIDTNNHNLVSVVASGGSRGDFATVGPDGCFYVTQSDKVVKLAPCFFQAPTADLSVVNTASVSSTGVLQPFAYSIVVTNNGPSTATAATLTDPLPSGVTFVSAGSTQGSCGQSAGLVTCDLGSIPSGGSATVTVAVTGGLLPGTVANTATVKGAEADPNTANNSSTATAEVTLLGPAVATTPTPTPTPTPSPTVLGQNFQRGRALPVTGPRFPLGPLGLLGLCLLVAGVVLVRRGRGRSPAEAPGETPGSRGERD